MKDRNDWSRPVVHRLKRREAAHIYHLAEQLLRPVQMYEKIILPYLILSSKDNDIGCYFVKKA